ncbi:hypothetical protein BLNAU_11766 [Blattamonas nauphoetae]|uniref:Thioredoxin domain-containing protein n=1 Tax=Blattamonas nauphoetae TaxID=2049346 RepID=A0ABQ9XLK4_9EUKA|nr:hypothetical protein BLNAU_11766 [Blattamonas nauphoetae]
MDKPPLYRIEWSLDNSEIEGFLLISETDSYQSVVSKLKHERKVLFIEDLHQLELTLPQIHPLFDASPFGCITNDMSFLTLLSGWSHDMEDTHSEYISLKGKLLVKVNPILHRAFLDNVLSSPLLNLKADNIRHSTVCGYPIYDLTPHCQSKSNDPNNDIANFVPSDSNIFSHISNFFNGEANLHPPSFLPTDTPNRTPEILSLPADPLHLLNPDFVRPIFVRQSWQANAAQIEQSFASEPTNSSFQKQFVLFNHSGTGKSIFLIYLLRQHILAHPDSFCVVYHSATVAPFTILKEKGKSVSIITDTNDHSISLSPQRKLILLDSVPFIQPVNAVVVFTHSSQTLHSFPHNTPEQIQHGLTLIPEQLWSKGEMSLALSHLDIPSLILVDPQQLVSLPPSITALLGASSIHTKSGLFILSTRFLFGDNPRKLFHPQHCLSHLSTIADKMLDTLLVSSNTSLTSPSPFFSTDTDLFLFASYPRYASHFAELLHGYLLALNEVPRQYTPIAARTELVEVCYREFVFFTLLESDVELILSKVGMCLPPCPAFFPSLRRISFTPHSLLLSKFEPNVLFTSPSPTFLPPLSCLFTVHTSQSDFVVGAIVSISSNPPPPDLSAFSSFSQALMPSFPHVPVLLWILPSSTFYDFGRHRAEGDKSPLNAHHPSCTILELSTSITEEGVGISSAMSRLEINNSDWIEEQKAKEHEWLRKPDSDAEEMGVSVSASGNASENERTMLFGLLIVDTLCSDIIDLDTAAFKEKVLKSDDTYFVMLQTRSCGACHQSLPAVEKLATTMKSIGINVGTVMLDNNPEIARTYKANSVPKFLLFRPGMKPTEYKSERSPKAMGKFIMDNQLGGKYISVLDTEPKVESYFSAANSTSRMLLFSKKTTIPPMFKQICYKHRATKNCGFISSSHSTLSQVSTNLAALGTFDIDTVEYPSIFFFEVGDQVKLEKFDGNLKYDSLDEYLSKGVKSSPKKSQKQPKKQEQKETAEPDPPKAKTEKADATPPKQTIHELQDLTEELWKEALNKEEFAIIFAAPEGSNEEKRKRITDIIEPYTKEHFHFYATSQPLLADLQELVQSLNPPNKPCIFALNLRRKRGTMWVDEDEEQNWKHASLFLDRIAGGDVRYTALKASNEPKNPDL